MRNFCSTLLLAGLLGLPACAYQVIQPEAGEGQVLHVPTTVNDTRWRGIEVSSTRSLRQEAMSQLDLELGSQGAYDLVLKTRFAEVDRRTSIGNRDGGFSVGTGRIRLEWQLHDARGEILSQGTVLRELEFLPGGAEDLGSAAAEIVEDMAEQIVLELGADLGATPTRNR